MLKVEKIFKSFAEKEVLKGISLELHEGEIYGLIGKNGAGKTTLMNIIAMVLQSDSGKIFVDGKEIKTLNDLSGQIGYVIDIPSAFEYLTPMQYLEFLLSPKGLTKTEIKIKSMEALVKLNLEDSANKQIKTFSRGMKQRMGIASGIICDPKIIIFDEPSSALDPEGRSEVLQIIDNLAKEGKVVLLSTHILDDIERICDKIGILIDGKIVLEGSTQQITEQFSYNIVCVECSKDDRVLIKNKLSTKEYITSVNDTPKGVEVSFEKVLPQKVFKDVLTVAKTTSSIKVKTMTLEELFIKLNKGEN